MDGQLKLVITADNKAALAALNTTDAALLKTSTIAQKTGAQIAKGSNQAGQSLVNLGRIAQDAPFGFIGIQNNLNPMLESFQRLKAETGSTGTALKAMAAGLMGPAGIGIALSVGSALLLTFGDKLFNAKKKTDEVAIATAEYTKVMQSANKQAGEEVANAKILYDASQNIALSMKDRLKAATELKDLYPQLFTQYSAEQIALGKAKDAYSDLTIEIIKNARAKAYAEKIGQLETDKFNAETQKAKINNAINQQKNPAKTHYIGVKGFGMLVTKEKEILGLEKERAKALKEQDALIIKATNEQGFYKSIMGETALQQGVVNGLKEKELKTGKYILDDLNKYLLLTTAIDKSGFKKGDSSPIDTGTKVRGGFDPNIEKQLSQNETDKNLALISREQIILNNANAQKKENYELEQANQLANIGTQAFATMFDALLNGGNVFDALGNSIKRMVVDLAAAVVQAFLFKAIMTALDSGTGGIVGGAVKVLGGRAIGGVSTGPKSGYPMMLHGTEAVLTPHQMTGIINQSMNAGAMQGMQSGGGESGGSFTLRGNDLVLALQRSNSSLNLRRG